MKTWPLYCFCNVEPLFPLLHFGSHPQSVSVPSGSRLARVLLVLTTTLKSSCSFPRSVMEQRRPRHATTQPNPISDSRHAGLLPPWRWSSLQHNKQKTVWAPALRGASCALLHLLCWLEEKAGAATQSTPRPWFCTGRVRWGAKNKQFAQRFASWINSIFPILKEEVMASIPDSFKGRDLLKLADLK